MNDLTSLIGASGSQVNLLMWNSPEYLTGPPYSSATPQFQHAHVRVSEATFPSIISEGTFIANVSGSGDSYLIHRNIENASSYYYALWAGFGTPVPGSPLKDYPTTYYGPYFIGPLTPASGAQFCDRFKVSFTKLESNTRMYSKSEKFYTTDLIIWLADGQENRKNAIIQALQTFKPAHTIIRVFWEPYYVVQTTTAQFSSGSYDSSVYTIENGTLINVVSTIDSSYGGNTSI